MLKETLYENAETGLKIEAPYAHITERDKMFGPEPETNAVRLYKATPNGYAFQIRTHTPIYTKGKARNMIAHVELTIDDLRRLMAWAEAHEKL